MQGATGPYVQFAHARSCSIERKFVDMYPEPATPDFSLITRDDEKSVLIHISRLQGNLERCVENDDPSILAHALIDLASTTSSWYSVRDHSAKVLCDNAQLAATRVQLVHCARIAIGEGLRLLGLQAPERM